MRRAVLESPRKLNIVEGEKPRINNGDILIQVAACAICGTDVKKYHHGHRLIRSYPIVPGHEIAGEVVEVGKRARKFKINVKNRREIRTFCEGDKIIVAPVIACENCVNCKAGLSESCNYREDFGFNYDGGFAEYAVIPEKLLRKSVNPVIKIPHNVPFYMAALSEPYACVLHAHKKLVRPGSWDLKRREYGLIKGIVAGDAVAVIGGGPLGCMHAEIARSLGAKPVIIVQHSQLRLEIIKNLGVADHYVLNKTTDDLVEAIKGIMDGRGVDIAITATSSPIAQVQALEIVKRGGVISFFGGVNTNRVELPTNKIHYNGPFITGTSGASPYHIPIILELMASGKLDPTSYITHLMGLDYLERVLLLNGVPAFISVEKIINIYGAEYLKFLNKERLGFKKQMTLEEKAESFKGIILKALVIPSFSCENPIISLNNLSIKEKRKTLNRFVG